MKYIIIIAISALLCSNAQAQYLEVSYEFFFLPKKTEKQLDENPNATTAYNNYLAFQVNSFNKKMLTVSPQRSAYIDLGQHLRDSSISRVSSTQVNPDYYIDFAQKTMYQTAPKIRGIMTKEPLEQTIIWTLTEETKTVLGYVCQKATGVKTKPTVNQKADTKNAPAQIEAWFCPKLATSAGPSFYFGLPGLILELVDNDKNYKATQIKMLKAEKHEVEMPTEPRTVSIQEFRELIQEKILELSSRK